MPLNEKDLMRIPHFGKKSLEKYGADLLQLVTKFIEDRDAGRLNEEDEIEKKSVKNASRPNESTYETSLRLFREGKTISEIAEIRDLTQGTIMGHIARFVESGEVQFDEVVSAAHFERIKNYFKAHPYNPEVRLADVRNDLGGDILYGEIRLALFKMGLVKEVKL